MPPHLWPWCCLHLIYFGCGIPALNRHLMWNSLSWFASNVGFPYLIGFQCRIHTFDSVLIWYVPNSIQSQHNVCHIRFKLNMICATFDSIQTQHDVCHIRFNLNMMCATFNLIQTQHDVPHSIQSQHDVCHIQLKLNMMCATIDLIQTQHCVPHSIRFNPNMMCATFDSIPTWCVPHSIRFKHDVCHIRFKHDVCHIRFNPNKWFTCDVGFPLLFYVRCGNPTFRF